VSSTVFKTLFLIYKMHVVVDAKTGILTYQLLKTVRLHRYGFSSHWMRNLRVDNPITVSTTVFLLLDIVASKPELKCHGDVVVLQDGHTQRRPELIKEKP